MELMLKDIKVCEYNRVINTSYSSESDIIVPDTKPDIYKVLCVNAVADLTEHYIRQEKVVFAGGIKFNIMYVGDNDKQSIYTIDYYTPFNYQADVSGAEDDYVCTAICNVSSTEFKIKNSRKLMVKGNMLFNAHITNYLTKKAIEGIEDADIPCRKKQVISQVPINSKNFVFSLSDIVNVPVESEETAIYDISASITPEEIKMVNNKAIIKGAIPIKVFYLSDTSPCVYELESAFTEIVDIDMAVPECVTLSRFSVGDITYDAKLNENELSIEVDIKVNAILEAYETAEYSIVSDIYSPDYRYNVVKDESGLERYTKLAPGRITVKDIIGSKNAENDIAEILYMNVYPSCENTLYKNSNVVVCGKLQTVVIYKNSQSEMCSIQKVIPYEAEIGAVHGLENPVFDVSVSTVNYGYVLSSESDVQVRAVLNFDVGAYTKGNVVLITDFAVDKNCPIDKSAQSGIVVCYTDGSMTLWDYAVKYNTTCKEIALVNNLDEDKELSLNVPLIIPKRQIC